MLCYLSHLKFFISENIIGIQDVEKRIICFQRKFLEGHLREIGKILHEVEFSINLVLGMWSISVALC